MNKPAQIIAVSAAVLILSLTGNSPAQERNSGSTSDPAGFQGGWVIEIGDTEQLEGDIYVPATEQSTPETAERPTVTPASPGIELIIGGQGSGGVAKKSTLPVVD